MAMNTKRIRSSSGKNFRGKETYFVLILLFLCTLLYFFQLGNRPLWDGDEGMHATTSKEMVLRGDWVTPTFNGEKFYDKPILYNWFVSLSFLIFGFTEFAARLPSALLGTGCVMIVYLLGRNLFGPMVGFLSGVILATSGEQIILSRVVVHDIALTFFITLSLTLFYMGFQNESQRKRYVLLFYASSGFAVLAKGPVGVLLPTLIIGLFLLIRKRRSLMKEWVSLPGILLFLAIAAPWYALISLRNRDYGSYFFIHQNLMNFLSAEARHSGPFYFYFPVLLGGFFPWACFLPLALFRAFRGLLKEREDRIVFLVLWFFVVFLFFSTASSKLPTYVLPLFPAASCLVGHLWHDLLKTPASNVERGFLYSFVLLFGILILAMVYLWFNPLAYLKSDYGLDLEKLKYDGLPLLCAFVIPFCLFLSRHWKACFFTMAGAIVLMVLFAFLAILPLMDPYQSTKGLAQKLDRMLAPGENLVMVRVMRDSALFYTDRKALMINTRKELMDFLNSHERVYCIIRRSLFESVETLRSRGHILDQEGHKVILSNQK